MIINQLLEPNNINDRRHNKTSGDKRNGLKKLNRGTHCAVLMSQRDSQTSEHLLVMPSEVPAPPRAP